MYRVVLPGKLLGATPLTATYAFLTTLAKYGARCTRFDWAIDDFSKTLSVEHYQEMAEAGCYYGARSHMLYRSAHRKCAPEQIARTVYVGATDGTQRLCIYDKFLESSGEINAIRIEYRFYDEKADYFFHRYVDNYAAGIPPNDITQCCTGRIGFHITPNLTPVVESYASLWGELVLLFGSPIKTTFPKLPRTIEQKEDWIKKQVIPTLAFLSRVNGFYDVLRWVKYLVSEALSSLAQSKIHESNYLIQWSQFVDDIATGRRGVCP
jgi:DNA relaxase NicK